MFSNTYEQSIIFSEKVQMSSFLEKMVDEIEDYRCECKISESCVVCETKKWMQMLQQFNGILNQQQMPVFPEDNFNVPLYLSKVYEIIHAVFIFKSATMKNLNNHEDEFFKIRSDNESLKVKAKRLQEEIDQKIKQIGQLENQITLLNKSNKLVNDKLLSEKEELNQKVIKIQNKVQLMQSEFKKKELEFLKMKDQLRSKDRINYANRYDVIPLKTQTSQQNGFDTWVSTRKGLIDEVCSLQDTLSTLISILNHFFQSLNNGSDIFNPDIVRLPQQGGKSILWIKQQLQKLNGQFNIDDSFLKELPQLSSSFISQEQQQQYQQPLASKQQQLNLSHNKTNSISNSGKKDNFKMINRSQTLHFQQQQPLPDETISILSRISINDVSLVESTNSAKFAEKPPQDKQQLKKWEFVFKQQ
ncbi:unnamed protein product [Paramecium octaurelia]|uniref:Uncharacterized protein n=1 Tax=Paramecium octaurelia TaxID=43137 RepID=A0A8S1V2K6_PAROT|nr:unnamed protein product [Paramecium octaurelia]